MDSLKRMSVMAALGLVLAAAPIAAQGTGAQPPTQPPTGQPPTTPPATPPAQPPATPPPAPAPFPEGAKVAYVVAQAVFENSAYGKVAQTRVADLEKKLTADIQEKMKVLEGNRTKLQQGGSVLSAQAAAQLQRDIEKQERELQFAQQDANTELNQLREGLLQEFQVRLNPVLEEIRKEKGLHMIFNAGDGALAAADVGLNLSGEVIKRLDAAKPAAPADKK